MPEYRFKCECGTRTAQWRPMKDSSKPEICAECGNDMVRDFQAEGYKGHGELPDWISENAGVGLGQVRECNEMYAHLGVTFDSKGKAHVPGRNRMRFLKERGLTELADAPRRNNHGRRFHVVDGDVVEMDVRPCG